MRRPDWPAVALAAFVALTVAASADVRVQVQNPQQPPTFRSAASAVSVDVSVRDGSRRPIRNLQAADFEVFDNGVPQDVDNVSYGKLPIDVTVALDVSYSVTGALLDRLRRGVVQLMGDLSRQDRLKLILFNMRVNRIVDFTTDVDSVERALRTAAGGGTALLDAISVAMVSGSSADRRQLIVFFTDGADTSSVTTPDALTAVAKRTRATVTFVMPGISSPVTRAVVGNTTMMTTSASANLPPGRPLAALFSTLASETGGSVIPVSATTDLSGTFRRVLEDFRSAYVLYYNARDVDRGGYHTIEVKVKREGATVQARRGYWY